MLPKESVNELKKLNGLSILAMEDTYVSDGVVGGYVTSGNKQGQEAAKLLLEYLHKNSLEGIKSIKSNSNIYMFDAKELVKSRILLSEYIRREAMIINKQSSYLEKHRVAVLEIFLLVLLVLIFIFTAIYAIQRRKNARQFKRIVAMNRVKTELLSRESLLRHIIEEENLAYWTLNMQTDKLYLSDALINKLQIEIDIYKNDKDFLSYFIHLNDKKLFNDKIQELQSSHRQLHFEHRMIDSHNTTFIVKHLLFCEATQNEAEEKDSFPTIVGILKFEE